MVKVLVYSQCVSATASNEMMERTLSGVLLPFTKYIYQQITKNDYQQKTEDDILLFITSEEVRYLEACHPEQNMLITSLVKKNLIKMLTGTYHNINPIVFSAKTISDDVEQMTTFLRRQYTRRPVAFFPYASIWTPSIASALEDTGIEEVYFPSFKNILNYPEGAFEISNLNKVIRVYHASETIDSSIEEFISGHKKLHETIEKISEYIKKSDDDIIIGLNLDELSKVEDGANFAIELLSRCRMYNTNVKGNKLYPLFFMPSGCYSSLYNGTNMLGDELKNGDNFNLARVFFIKSFLQYSGNKKLIGDKKYLDALLCSISSSALSFDIYSDLQYQTKLTRDFYTIVSSLSTRPFFKYTFRHSDKEYKILLSRGLFVLLSKEGDIRELGMLSTGIDFVKNGYAFSDVISAQNSDASVSKIKLDYEIKSDNTKTHSDVTVSSLFNGVDVCKEFHIRTSSLTIHINFKNTEKKNATFTYSSESLLSFLSLVERKTQDNVSSLRLRVLSKNGNNDTIHFSSSKEFSPSTAMSIENDQIKFTPTWDVRLKKDESFDLTFTIRYDKGQEAQNDNRKPIGV